MNCSPFHLAFLLGEACWVPPPEWQGTRFAARRMFFEGHLATHGNSSMVCSACGLPTLTLFVEGEYCGACAWEDDFSDEPFADEASNLNGGISLNQARRNILDKGTLFCETDRSWMHPTQYESTFSPGTQAHRNRLFALFDGLMTLTEPVDIAHQWAVIEEHWRSS